MARYRYPRISKLHIDCIKGAIKAETSYLHEEYMTDFDHALPNIDSICVGKDKLYFCEQEPTYPHFLMGWDYMRMAGVEQTYRSNPHMVVGLCYSCTLLVLDFKTHYYQDAVKSKINSYPKFSEIYESAQLVQDKLLSPLYRAAQAYCNTVSRATVVSYSMGGVYAKLGTLTRIGLEEHREHGIITLVFSKPEESEGNGR